jgi:hypothetical protein
VPDLNRGSAFAVIFLVSAFQVIAKATAVALLVVTNGQWLLQYIVADHALHLICRVARRDYFVFMPMPLAASYAVAPLFHVMNKTMSDFTGSFTFRRPLMLGGSYWLFNLAMSQASVFVCVHLYLEDAGDPKGGRDKIAADTLWAGAAGLAAGWLTTFTYERASEANGPPWLTPSRAQLFRVPHRGPQVPAHALVADEWPAVRARLLL